MNTETPVQEPTIAELEAMLKQKKAAQTKALEKARSEYEKGRDEMVSKVLTTARVLFTELSEFKTFCHIEMDKQAVKLAEYGEIRSNSKGGFSVTNSDDSMKVTRKRDTEPAWDERAGKAVELIKDFLGDTIKKRDVQLYTILMGFLEKNKAGDLEYSDVMNLYKHENEFNDPRWKEGLKLIKESFSNHLKGYGYEFKVKGEDGKWQKLYLNFSSL